MSKRKAVIPPPNQPSIKAFITGGSVGWRAGESPLLGGIERKQDTDIHRIEKDIHDKILDAGIFHHFLNQPAALAYLNGQFILRRKHHDQIKKFENSISKFLKSGVTKRFLKVPTKLLPKDKSNCEQEVIRATKVVSDIEQFKKELLLMKKHCLDEGHSIKPKKREEYEYYSDTIDVIEGLADKLDDIKTKLEGTNLIINKSGGSVTKAVSVLENKRIMRRRKENIKINTRKAFNRDVESLKRFLSKYTSKDFDAIFHITENKVAAPANHFAKKRQKRKTSPSEVEVEAVDDTDCEHGQGEVVDFDVSAAEVQDNSSPQECSDKLLNSIDADDVISLESVDMEGPGVIDLDSDVINSDGKGVDLSEDSRNNNNGKDRKKKYQNLRIERSIVLNRKLEVQDFDSLEFDKKDLKSLNLLLSLKVAEKSLKELIESKCQKWQLEKPEKEKGVDAQENEVVKKYVNQVIGSETVGASKVIEIDADEEKKVIKGLKKKYKSIIKCVLDENGNKMKRKKLKKEVVKRSGGFDECDDTKRGESFENFIVKVKNVVPDGKYVRLMSKD